MWMICSAGRLEVLDLSNNNFNGTIPICLGNFSTYLSILNLGKNGFQGTMPQTYANTINTLVFKGNKLEGTMPGRLSDCYSLELLDIENNKINNTFPFWLENLPQLRVLVLRFEQIPWTNWKSPVQEYLSNASSHRHFIEDVQAWFTIKVLSSMESHDECRRWKFRPQISRKEWKLLLLQQLCEVSNERIWIWI